MAIRRLKAIYGYADGERGWIAIYGYDAGGKIPRSGPRRRYAIGRGSMRACRHAPMYRVRRARAGLGGDAGVFASATGTAASYTYRCRTRIDSHIWLCICGYIVI